jgi:RNA polymerase sigma-70 factor (ECF subfamily)
LRDAGRRVPPAAKPPFEPPEPSRYSEVTWLEPYPDTLLVNVPDDAPGPEARYQQREAIELAFVAGLQRMRPRQAAVLVLCDVLGYPTGEVANMLDTTPTAVKGALQRARTAIDHDRPVRTARLAPGSAEERDLSRRFADAFAARDIDTLLTLLTDDAWLAMPPAPHEYHGLAAIQGFLAVSGAWRGARRLLLVPTRANTQPAFGCYLAEPGASAGGGAGVMVLTLRGPRVGGLTRFLHDDVLARFHLPTSWPVP